jgi:hypothetical protein
MSYTYLLIFVIARWVQWCPYLSTKISVFEICPPPQSGCNFFVIFTPTAPKKSLADPVRSTRPRNPRIGPNGPWILSLSHIENREAIGAMVPSLQMHGLGVNSRFLTIFPIFPIFSAPNVGAQTRSSDGFAIQTHPDTESVDN